MKRWHEERSLMLRRWKIEMDKHEYDRRCPPTDPSACHCAKGIGSQRKSRPYGCRRMRCGLCHFEKYYLPKRRAHVRRESVKLELAHLDDIERYGLFA